MLLWLLFLALLIPTAILFGKVHPVWLIFAPVLVIEQIMEVVFFDRGIQKALGQWLFALLA